MDASEARVVTRPDDGVVAVDRSGGPEPIVDPRLEALLSRGESILRRSRDVMRNLDDALEQASHLTHG